MQELKLCYVDDNFAYFTTNKLEHQWGDDWNDAPYEHNAGLPYKPLCHYETSRGDKAWEIVKVAFDGDSVMPDNYHCNSPYSVEKINSGTVAWLSSPSYSDKNISIFAGSSLKDFIRSVKDAGGQVYLSEDVIKRFL